MTSVVPRFAVVAPRSFDGRAFGGPTTVVVADGRIVGVEGGHASLPDDCPVTTYADATLLPGLVDPHVHLVADGGPQALDRAPTYDAQRLDVVIDAGLAAMLRYGVTTVRDLGDLSFCVVDRRDRQRAGATTGPEPHLLAAGPPITRTGGHCWFLGGEANGSAGLRAAVRERVERRVDVVKVMGSGGFMTPGTDVTRPQYDDDLLRQVLDDAHAAGLPVTVHAHALAAVEQAVRLGADGIEHASCVTANGLDLTAALLRDLTAARTAVCPTLGVDPAGEPPPSVVAALAALGVDLEDVVHNAGVMWRAGVRVTGGSDSGINPGKPHGLAGSTAVNELVRVGVPAADALAAATFVAAEVCGVGDRAGRLAADRPADLLVVRGDPRHEIADLQRVAAVWVAGERVGPGPTRTDAGPT